MNPIARSDYCDMDIIDTLSPISFVVPSVKGLAFWVFLADS